MKKIIIKAAAFCARRTTNHLFTTTLGTMVIMVSLWSVIWQAATWTEASGGITVGAGLLLSKDPFP